MVKVALDKGYEVAVVDSLERGHRDSVDKRAQFILGDLKDKKLILPILFLQICIL